jgi:hypothetical protein
MNYLAPLAALLPVLVTPQDNPAPEISSDAWVNHFGQAPTNASLLGSAVLIEAWATW